MFFRVCDRSICHRVLELDLISSFFSDEFLAGLNSHFPERRARGRIQRKIWRNFLIKRETPYLIIIGRQKKLEKSWKIVLFFQLFSKNPFAYYKMRCILIVESRIREDKNQKLKNRRTDNEKTDKRNSACSN